jgi:hypothetical protein
MKAILDPPGVTERRIGRLFGLELSFVPSALAGWAFLWVFFGLLGRLIFHRGVLVSIAGGAVLVALHILSEILHNVGHAVAARRTGYPMTGLRMWGIFGTSVYPEDEGQLPARVHIRRAVGGPVGSATAAAATGVMAAATAVVLPRFTWIPLLFFLDNLLVFFLGNFVPVGFNDASTFLHWRKRRES